jgi:SAM-dependent methyltransferase
VPYQGGVSQGPYVHGYGQREADRLADQAGTLVDLLHEGTSYARGARVLEVGCGIGAQTVTLAQGSPSARFISVDISAASLAEARRRVGYAGSTNVEFWQADIFAPPFRAGSFDHVFVCFVLEHLSAPVEALVVLSQLLKPGGSITVIEGDHGSAYFYPDSSAARAAIQCLVELQRSAGGNSLIGRQLYPLLVEAGLDSVRVSPRTVYVDSSRPDLVDGFTRRTFTAMIEGVRGLAIEKGLILPDDFDAGVRALHRAAEEDGVFCYTFFKATAVRGIPSLTGKWTTDAGQCQPSRGGMGEG